LAAARFFIFLDEKRKEAVTLGAASLKLSQMDRASSIFDLGLPVVTSLLTITDRDDKDTPEVNTYRVLWRKD
jgi:hypothetical protein